jgi:hypothetical protein
LYSSPHSSSIKDTLRPFGVNQVKRSINLGSPLSDYVSRLILGPDVKVSPTVPTP